MTVVALLSFGVDNCVGREELMWMCSEVRYGSNFRDVVYVRSRAGSLKLWYAYHHCSVVHGLSKKTLKDKE
jgi:hypothetical protein